MAIIANTLHSLRARTEPDWLQKFSEKHDLAWQGWGKGVYEKGQAAQYAAEHPPTVEAAGPVPEMPDPEAIQRQARRSQASQRNRGRASTIFTPPGEGLGG